MSNGGRSSVGRAPDCDSGGRGFKPRRSPQIEGEDWEDGLTAFAAKGLPVQTPLFTPDEEIGSPPLIQQTCESGGIGRRAGFRYQYRKM